MCSVAVKMSYRADRNNRSKYWCFTSFLTENEPRWDPITMEYLIYGKENCPTSRRSHWQAFVAFKSRVRFSTVRALYNDAHIERVRGTVEDNIRYCKKDGEFKEYGTPPRLDVKLCAFKETIKYAREGKLSTVEDLHPGLFLRYKKTLDTLRQFDVAELTNACGVWIYGPARIGKDYAIRTLVDVYMKNNSKWWDGYDGEKFVLLCDIEPEHGKWIGYYLKIWSDRYEFNAEVKGGTTKIRPKKIYVTSNYSMESIFSGEILKALQARFDYYDFSGDDFKLQRRQVSAINTRVLKVLQAHDDAFQTEEIVSQTCSSVPPLPLWGGWAQGNTPSLPWDEIDWNSTADFQS